jgi:transposase
MITSRSGAAFGIILLLLAAFMTCTSNRENDMKERQLSLRSQIEGSIADIDKARDRLKIDIDAASTNERDRLNRSLDRLDRARSDLQEKLDRMGETTAEKWDEFQRSVDRSLDNAREALRDV